MNKRKIFVATAAVLVSSCGGSVPQLPDAPGINKVQQGMSEQQIDTALGEPIASYQAFGLTCNIYQATSSDGRDERPHYVTFRNDLVIDFGEGDTQEHCFGSLLNP